MSKIRRVQLQQFQKHTIKTIDFDEGVTSIVGRTGAGKSSILRAIRWISLNKPQGNVLTKKGRKTAIARLRTERAEISRIKSDTVNSYRIGKEEYKSFGSKVPQDVEELIGLEEINFQQQHDPLFWISLTPGQLLKEINKINDMELMDIVLKRLKSRKRKSLSEISIRKESNDQLRQEIESLDKAIEMEHRILPIEDKLEQLQETNARLSALEKSVNRVRTLHKDTEDLRQAIRRPEWGHLKGQIDECVEVSQKIESLDQKISKIREMRTKVQRNRMKAKSLRRKFNRKIRRSACPICGRPPEKK